MKTGRTPLFAGIFLVLVQLLLVLFSAMGSGAALAWAKDGFWHAIFFCLPAIIGISLISAGLRRRKEIERLMRDPNQTDPWNR